MVEQTPFLLANKLCIYKYKASLQDNERVNKLIEPFLSISLLLKALYNIHGRRPSINNFLWIEVWGLAVLNVAVYHPLYNGFNVNVVFVSCCINRYIGERKRERTKDPSDEGYYFDLMDFYHHIVIMKKRNVFWNGNIWTSIPSTYIYFTSRIEDRIKMRCFFREIFGILDDPGPWMSEVALKKHRILEDRIKIDVAFRKFL